MSRSGGKPDPNEDPYIPYRCEYSSEQARSFGELLGTLSDAIYVKKFRYRRPKDIHDFAEDILKKIHRERHFERNLSGQITHFLIPTDEVIAQELGRLLYYLYDKRNQSKDQVTTEYCDLLIEAAENCLRTLQYNLDIMQRHMARGKFKERLMGRNRFMQGLEAFEKKQTSSKASSSSAKVAAIPGTGGPAIPGTAGPDPALPSAPAAAGAAAASGTAPASKVAAIPGTGGPAPRPAIPGTAGPDPALPSAPAAGAAAVPGTAGPATLGTGAAINPQTIFGKGDVGTPAKANDVGAHADPKHRQ